VAKRIIDPVDGRQTKSIIQGIQVGHIQGRISLPMNESDSSHEPEQHVVETCCHSEGTSPSSSAAWVIWLAASMASPFLAMLTPRPAPVISACAIIFTASYWFAATRNKQSDPQDTCEGVFASALGWSFVGGVIALGTVFAACAIAFDHHS
jgi:hypothetical protein